MTRFTDTHSLVWFLSGSKRLSDTARAAFNDISVPLVIPGIVLGEIAFLHARGRVGVSVPDVLAHVGRDVNCSVRAFDAAVALRLPFGLEMHDAMIVATVLLHQQQTQDSVALITRDEQITASGLVPVIW